MSVFENWGALICVLNLFEVPELSGEREGENISHSFTHNDNNNSLNLILNSPLRPLLNGWESKNINGGWFGSFFYRETLEISETWAPNWSNIAIQSLCKICPDTYSIRRSIDNFGGNFILSLDKLPFSPLFELARLRMAPQRLILSNYSK